MEKKKLKCYQINGDTYILKRGMLMEKEYSFIQKISSSGISQVTNNIKENKTISDFEKWFSRSFIRKVGK